MATEKFFVFNEDGTLKRLKGRIVRFLDNEDPDNDDKVAIRASISVPAAAEGLTPANNLSDVSSVETARTNLSVNSVDEDAEANGTKLLGPSLYFGASDVVTVATDTKLDMTDGTDDLPFSACAFLRLGSDYTNVGIFDRFNANEGYALYLDANGKLLFIFGDGSVFHQLKSDVNLAAYAGKNISVGVTYGGSGPNSSTIFDLAPDAATLYINGSAVAATATYAVGYTGQNVAANALDIGKYASLGLQGHLYSLKLFNRELSSSEIADLARGNELGFADQWGGASGAVYTSDFSNPDVGGDEDLDGFSATRGTADGNIDTIGGQDDNLRLTVTDTTNNTHYLSKSSVVTVGKRTRFSLDFYIPSGQSNVDGIQLRLGSTVVATETSPTLDSWVTITGEGIPNSTALRVDALDGGSGSFQDAGGDDVLYVRNVTVTEIGTLADFRASNFDVDTGKLYDLSDNAFIGTNTGSTLVGRALPVYETGTWTPSLEFGGASVGITYGDTEGVYTRVGNQVTIQGIVTLTSKGSSTGFVRLLGLPFAGADGIKSYNGIFINQAGGMASLTSIPSITVVKNTTEATIQDWSATGSGGIDDTYFTNTSSLRFSGTYQIQ